MVQKIRQGNIFGRIGTGFAKGLSETVPKMLEQRRLASGLQQFEQDAGNLTPLQQGARLAAIPGISPQAIQTLGDLAKQQSQGNAFRRGAGGNPRPGQQEYGMQPQASPQGSQDFRNPQFNNPQSQQSGQSEQQGQPPQQGQKIPPVGSVNNQQSTPNMGSGENTPKVVEGNVLNEQNLARLPWTPQQRNQTIADYIDQGFLPDQAKQLQADDESRDLGEPAVYQQRQADLETAKGKVRNTLKRHLETKLQKTGEGVYKDVEGKMILNAERGMTRDLIKNPKADIDNVANDWSERLYNTALAKDKLKKLGKTTGFENFFKGDTQEKKLREYQDIFKRSGNLEEFNTILQGPEFGMSAQGAASQAYPPNQKINKIQSNWKPSSPSSPHKYQEARKAALDIESDIGPDDSVLAIARKFSDKDPFFDQQSFLDQLSEDKERLGLNERQRLELAEGARNIIPNWADVLYLPTFFKGR